MADTSTVFTLPAPGVMRDRAVALAEAGYRVFRLAPGSRSPLRDVSWTTEATDDPLRVDLLWGEEAFNIGIACGGGRGLFVVDLDCKKGKDGDARWAELIAAHGDVGPLRTVRTTSGGRHLYFEASGVELPKNSVSRVAPGIDIRADGGFVVAPGSVIPEGEYTLVADAALPPPPQWLLQRATKHAPTLGDVSGPVAADAAENLHAAIAWLYGAPLAVEGEAGDSTTFAVAAKLKDFGVSPRRALDLMSHHWNDRCSPPWSMDELAGKVRNAFAYGANSFGAATAEAQLPPDIPGLTDEAVEAAAAKRAGADTPVRPPMVLRRPLSGDAMPEDPPWLIQGMAMLGQLTEIVAPGGVGKSMLSIAMANAVARGDGKYIGREIEPLYCGPVWVQNNEDPFDELARRQRAFENRWGTEPKAHDVWYTGSNDRIFRVTDQIKLPSGAVVQRPSDVDAAVAEIKARGIKLFVVDPFVSTHNADENDNSAMDDVARQYTRIAQQAGCAVVLVHHTRKAEASSSDGHAGSADSARGAGAVVNAARIVLTLYRMSEKDAKTMGVAKDKRSRFVRLDSAKANLAAADSRPAWFIIESVDVLTRRALDGRVMARPLGVIVPAPDPAALMGARPVAMDINAVMAGEADMPFADVRKLLMDHDPSTYQDDEGVRAQLTRAFKAGAVSFDDVSFELVNGGRGGTSRIVRKEVFPEV